MLIKLLTQASKRIVNVGGWYVWGHTPSLYRQTFARVATAVKAVTKQTAMLWAPNNAIGYPFGGGQYTPKVGDAKFAEMDTNSDGVINTKVYISPTLLLTIRTH